MSQRRRVLRLIVAANIPLVVLILVALWRAHRDEISQITEGRVVLSQTTALAADSFVAGTLSTLDSLTGALAGTALDAQRMQGLLQRVLERNGFERIGLARGYLRIAGRWQDHILFQQISGA